MTENSVQNNQIRLMFGFTLLLGILFDILFYNQSLGFNLVLMVILFFGIFLYFIPLNSIKLRFFHGFFLLILLLNTLPFLIYANDIFFGFNLLLVLSLTILVTVSITQGYSYQWQAIAFLKNMLDKIFPQMLKNFFQPLVLTLQTLKKNKPTHEKISNKNFKKVLIGLLISLPLLIAVISLLVAADEVFEKFITVTIPEFLKKINFSKMITHLMIIILSAVVFLGYIGNLWAQAKERQAAELEIKPVKKNWDPVIILTILIVLNVIYLLFAGVLFSYLFATQETTLTYAQYARKGFFELIVVAVINFGLYATIMRYMRNENVKLTKSVYLFLTLLVSLTFILLYSAFHRLYLYEQAYGLTYARIFAFVVMLALFLFFTVCLLRIWNTRIKLFPSTIYITLVLYTFMNYCNFDSWIAKKNIDLYLKNGKIDLIYLKSLSSDSIPQLIRLKDIEALKPDLTPHFINQKNFLSSGQTWQSFNFSKKRARFILDENFK